MTDIQNKDVTLSKTTIIWTVIVIAALILGREAYHYYKHQSDAKSISTLRNTLLAEYDAKEAALINKHIKDITAINERVAVIVQLSDALIVTNDELIKKLNIPTYKSKIDFKLTLAEALKFIDDYEYSSTNNIN